ncbi:MAG: DNA repair protein RecN (Recombination protein N) [Candidatus Marivariicella framensis]|jgi:DNA repair protein RecN (Recombination protein N)|tara:strand:+ start:4739 stop:6322 length:1584 start_codon:yes stop_codon:yes gene_type:complete
MTSVTGETGAGKSIILGALSLVLGKRADLSCLKNSAKKCIIEASFDISLYNLKDFFDSENIDYDKETILRRELIPSGKSRAFINDTPVNLDVLNKISTSLIDIHSQNETQTLFSNYFQFKFLDSLSNNIHNMKNFRIQFLEYNSLITLFKKLLNSKEVGSKELDYQKFLFNELETLNLETNTLSRIEAEVAELSNINLIENKLSSSVESINSDEDGILSRLSDILHNIKSIEKFSLKFKDYNYRIDSLYTELRDILNDFESHLTSLEPNPELLNEKNLELDNLYLILKKHNVSTIEDLIVIKNSLATVFFDSNSLSKKINEIKKLIDLKKESLLIFSKKIHSNRIKAIPKIENELKSLVLKLGMKNASFKLNLIEVNEFNEFGKEKLELLFSSNMGSNHKPLKKTASGGELSRIMLSIKYLTSKFHNLPTIIFDEIDAGVSGSVANEIGMLMKDMSKSTQVFTITHIPQVAARGKNHIKVFKQTIKSETITNLKELNRMEREDEIALMLSGKKMTISAQEHARELLD